MSLMFTCEDKATLVAYLYNEVDAEERKQVDDHLQTCAACAGEVAALSGVRTDLAMWAPPIAELGFAITQSSRQATAEESAPQAQVLRPAQWWNAVPVWAQAVAAILVLAVSAAVANVQVKSSADGFVVTTGWIAPAGTASPSPAVATITTDEQWKPALIALEQQLRNEIRATHDTTSVRAAANSGTDQATLARVQQLLKASEDRQTRELAFRLTQFTRDINMQRRADLLRINKDFGTFEGRTADEIARQRQMINYVIRASATPQQ